MSQPAELLLGLTDGSVCGYVCMVRTLVSRITFWGDSASNLIGKFTIRVLCPGV